MSILLASIGVFPAARGDTVYAEAWAQTAIDGFKAAEDRFVETDLGSWIAGGQRAAARSAVATQFSDLGAEARGDFQTGGSGGSFHLYASAYSDSFETAYPFAAAVMSLHYVATYEVTYPRRIRLVFVVPAAGTLNAVTYSAAGPAEVFAGASTSLGIYRGSGIGTPVLAYQASATISATDLNAPPIVDVTGEWEGDVGFVDNATIKVAALDALSGPLDLEQGEIFTVDYLVSTSAHASRTNFVNHVAIGDFRGTTDLQFTAFDAETGQALSGDVLALAPLAAIPEPSTWGCLGVGLAVLARISAARLRIGPRSTRFGSASRLEAPGGEQAADALERLRTARLVGVDPQPGGATSPASR